MNWLATVPAHLANGPLVLVTIAGIRGSAPREAGATMLVGHDFIAHSIGGGHLEWEAIAEARARLLTANTAPALRRYALAASLGQCCGGVVWLAFESLTTAQRPHWQAAGARFASGATAMRTLHGRGFASSWTEESGAGSLSLPSHDGADDWRLVQPIIPPAFCLNIYGAGHVGAALIRILASLDLHLRWLDPRAELLAQAPQGVDCLAFETVSEAVASAPPHSIHVVLSHDHALDLALTEAILRRDDCHWCGLIGSASKRARFRQQLLARGIAAAQLDRIHSPIGVAGIRDKAPQAIAIAVAAQVLQLREQYRHTPASLRSHA